MRHLTVVLAMLALLAASGSGTLARQNPATSPAAEGALAELGYPELRVRVTSDGLELPGEIPAGRVLLTVENTRDVATVVAPIRLADGDSIEDVAAAARGVEGNDALVPYRNAVWAGGEPALPGETTSGMVVTLTPGPWYVLDLSDLGAIPPTLTVTGDIPSDPGEVPNTAVSVEMTDFQFILPDRIEAGTHVWRFANIGEQLHDIHVLKVPDGTDPDDVLRALTRPEGAEPQPGELVVNETMIPMFGFGIMSGGQTIWTDVSIEPGTYVIVTWMDDEVTGAPQLTLGMVSVFTVVGPGEDGVPPASPEPAGPRA